jgi:hypothetical protein
MGQDWKLELYLCNLAHNIFGSETQVDTSGIDISMTQLFLEGIQSTTTVEEVNGITMSE